MCGPAVSSSLVPLWDAEVSPRVFVILQKRPKWPRCYGRKHQMSSFWGERVLHSQLSWKIPFLCSAFKPRPRDNSNTLRDRSSLAKYIITNSAGLSCPVQGVSQPCVLVAQDFLVCTKVSDTPEGVCKSKDGKRRVDMRRTKPHPRNVSLNLTYSFFAS